MAFVLPKASSDYSRVEQPYNTTSGLLPITPGPCSQAISVDRRHIDGNLCWGRFESKWADQKDQNFRCLSDTNQIMSVTGYYTQQPTNTVSSIIVPPSSSQSETGLKGRRKHASLSNALLEESRVPTNPPPGQQGVFLSNRINNGTAGNEAVSTYQVSYSGNMYAPQQMTSQQTTQVNYGSYFNY